MRSSPEWYESTAQRPCGASTSMASSMRVGEDVELGVDRDADGLERALGGVAAGAAGGGGDGVADELGQLAGGVRPGGRRRWRGRCGAAKRSSPKRAQDAGQLALVGAR